MTDTTERMTLAEALAAKKGTGRAKPQQREQAEQIALFGWRNAWQGKYPQLKWLHASLNGVPLGSEAMGAKAKRAGLTKGVWDLFLPGRALIGWKSGLYVEMKDAETVRKKGYDLTPEQQQFHDALIDSFEFVVCYSAQEAVTAICDYLGITDQRVRVL